MDIVERIAQLRDQKGWDTISALIRCLHPKQMLLTIYQLCQGFGIGLTEFFNSPLFDNKNITDE